MNNAYVYRHTDFQGKIFYVGISVKAKFKRAYSSLKRSKYWKEAAKDGFTVEILTHSIERSFAEELEQILIAWYGREHLGTGCLINRTKGGEKNPGAIPSKETREKKRLAMVGKMVGVENPACISIINTQTLKVYECIKDACEDFGVTSGTLSDYLSGKSSNLTPLIYLKDYVLGMPPIIPAMPFQDVMCPVINIETEETWPSIKIAAEKNGLDKNTLLSYLEGRAGNPTSLRYVNKENKSKNPSPKHIKRKIIDIVTNQIWNTKLRACKDNNIAESTLYYMLNGTYQNRTNLRYLDE